MKYGLIALIGLLFVASGCKFGGSSDAARVNSRTGGRALTITMIPRNGDDPEQLSARVGAETAASDLGKTLGVQITIDWRVPEAGDVASQRKAIHDAIAAKSSAVLLNPMDGKSLTPQIDEAVDNHVAVMTYANDAPDSKRFAYYGVNDQEAGQRVMREIERLTKGNARVAVFAGDPADLSSLKRTQGLLQEAARAPGIKIVGVYHSAENPQDASKEVIKQVALNPKIEAWAMVGPWPMLNHALIKMLDPAQTKVVALGCLPTELYFVDHGAVLFATPTYQMGYVAVQTIIRKVVQCQPVPAVTYLDLNIARVTRDSKHIWARNLKSWGFQDVPPDFLFKNVRLGESK